MLVFHRSLLCALSLLLISAGALLHAADRLADDAGDPAVTHAAHRGSRFQSAPVPEGMHSAEFTVTVNGQPVEVARAASSYDFVSFDSTVGVDITVTAAEPGFWDRGVDIQPWRLGIRPERKGQTIRFHLDEPAKLSIGRPGDFLNHARMLFLFFGLPPAPPAAGPKVRVVKAGVYHESLNPQSGETIYLEPGAYIFGSLNLWQVHDVKVLGRGVIVYEGQQDPNSDQGWMQRPDWHCIGSLESRDVQIDGLTCLVRARTWSIQMKDSYGFVYNDLRVIGGNPGNANQDGMDWLGGGDAVVRNSFLRASDDVFAMQGNWDGYTDADMLRPGHDVRNILIEHSVLSTSISNIVRAGWPKKIYNSNHFTMRDSDVLHGGIGACGQSFGLIGFWGAQGAKGDHGDYIFENIFLDNWYSLVQLEQAEPSLHDFTFRNIWALDQPALEASTLSGAVRDVSFENVKFGQTVAASNADLNLVSSNGAASAKYIESQGPQASFTFSPSVITPGQAVTFTANPVKGGRYTWLFGDGTREESRQNTITHRFPDALGTMLDGQQGAGRFRVLLKVEDRKGDEDWSARALIAVAKWIDSGKTTDVQATGLRWSLYPGVWSELPDLTRIKPQFRGEDRGLHADSKGFTRYVVVWEGLIEIPTDGGYSFHLMDRDGARVLIDDIEVARTGPAFAQVCGSPGNAVRYDRGSLGLRAGKHLIRVEGLHAASKGDPRLLWEGPAIPLTEVPTAAYSHSRRDAVAAPTAVIRAR